jgi:hypothetical protein
MPPSEVKLKRSISRFFFKKDRKQFYQVYSIDIRIVRLERSLCTHWLKTYLLNCKFDHLYKCKGSRAMNSMVIILGESSLQKISSPLI